MASNFTYMLILSIVINLFNIVLGATSSYLFDKLIKDNERRPVYRRRLVDFTFGVVFTMIIFKLGIMKFQQSIVESTNKVVSKNLF